MRGTAAVLTPAERDLLHALVRGADANDLAWATARTEDEVLTEARDVLVRLDPTLAERIGPDDQRRVADYMMLRQSPGQAAGTWEVLERSGDARRWAVWVRECLSEVYEGSPPAIPGVDDEAPGPVERARGGPGRQPPRGLGKRRRDRERRREIAQIEAAAAELQSPFRTEAIDAYREGQDRIKLPHFPSRPTRYAAWGLLVLLVLGLIASAFISVPEHTSGKVIVVGVPEGSADPVRGLGMVALFPADSRGDIERGQSLSVALPDTDERVSSRLRYVSDEVLSPREIADRFDLSNEEANRVRAPAVVAVAELRTPDGAPPASTFDGAVTSQVDVQTGTRRAISLVAP